MGQSGFSEEEIAQSMEPLAATVERMNTALAASGPWLISVDYVDSTSPRSPVGTAGWWRNCTQATARRGSVR